MKALFLLTFLLSATYSFSYIIPKKLLGKYETNVPDFEFEDNGRIVKASGYNLTINIREDYLWYYCGDIEFYGAFTQTSEDEDQVAISVNVSNNFSIGFDLELSLNKRTKSIAIKGLTGFLEVILEKREIVVTKKG